MKDKELIKREEIETSHSSVVYFETVTHFIFLLLIDKAKAK